MEFTRVRGLHDLSNLTVFQGLESLRLEDQIKLTEILDKLELEKSWLLAVYSAAHE